MSRKVAIIGMGYIGKVHLDMLLRVPNVEVVAIADANETIVTDLAKKFGIKKYSTNWHDLIDDPEITAYHNCTPNNLHFEINKVLLSKGKHVLSEKPLCLSKAQAKELARSCRREQLHHRHQSLLSLLPLCPGDCPED